VFNGLSLALNTFFEDYSQIVDRGRETVKTFFSISYHFFGLLRSSKSTTKRVDGKSRPGAASVDDSILLFASVVFGDRR
jgi:hypothetical protein